MDWLYGLGALVLVVVLAPLAMWLFSVAKPRRGGGMGAALGELNGFFDPSQRHVAKVAEERSIERKDDEPPL